MLHSGQASCSRAYSIHALGMTHDNKASKHVLRQAFDLRQLLRIALLEVVCAVKRVTLQTTFFLSPLRFFFSSLRRILSSRVSSRVRTSLCVASVTVVVIAVPVTLVSAVVVVEAKSRG